MEIRKVSWGPRTQGYVGVLGEAAPRGLAHWDILSRTPEVSGSCPGESCSLSPLGADAQPVACGKGLVSPVVPGPSEGGGEKASLTRGWEQRASGKTGAKESVEKIKPC